MIKKEFLRQQRHKRNWRQSDVAEQIGVSIVTIRRWEHGIQQPGPYYRARLCTLFGLSAEELETGEISHTSFLPARPTLPPEPVPVVSSQDSPLWTVPYIRNPHFTGRDDLLAGIDQRFALLNPRPAHNTHSLRSLALTGLSGIGKTQIAVEYAYRVREQESSTHVLWVTAASEGTILASFISIAHLLAEPLQHEIQPDKLVASVLHWLEQQHESWLLILDNADDLGLMQAYLPRRGHGHLLFTTQATAVGPLAIPIEVGSMEVEEAAHFLLHRTHRQDAPSSDEAAAARQIVAALSQFPLALDQAGAYIEENGCNFARYLQLYRDHHQTLLAKRGNAYANHPDPVATTWLCSFQWLATHNPAAAQFLQLSALLAPHMTPEQFILEGARFWPPLLQRTVLDPFTYDQMFRDLLAFSLVKRLTTNQMVSVHHLVQTIQRDQMTDNERYEWAKRIVSAMHTLFPLNHADIEARAHCLRYLGQVEAYNILVQQPTLESARLLEWSGSHLATYKLYHIAEPLLQNAFRIREQQRGLLHPETLLCLSSLAHVYMEQKQYGEACLLYDRLVHALSEQSGLQHTDRSSIQKSIHRLFAQNNVVLTREHQENLTRFLAVSSWYTSQAQQNVERSNDILLIVHEMKEQGASIREIARQIGVARNTARKYLRMEPQSAYRKTGRHRVLDPYKETIRTWVAENTYTSKEMFISLQMRGYTGSFSTLKAFVRHMRSV